MIPVRIYNAATWLGYTLRYGLRMKLGFKVFLYNRRIARVLLTTADYAVACQIFAWTLERTMQGIEPTFEDWDRWHGDER